MNIGKLRSRSGLILILTLVVFSTVFLLICCSVPGLFCSVPVNILSAMTIQVLWGCWVEYGEIKSRLDDPSFLDSNVDCTAIPYFILHEVGEVALKGDFSSGNIGAKSPPLILYHCSKKHLL